MNSRRQGLTSQRANVSHMGKCLSNEFMIPVRKVDQQRLPRPQSGTAELALGTKRRSVNYSGLADLQTLDDRLGRYRHVRRYGSLAITGGETVSKASI